jgi:signal transduction histidine kinase
MMKFLRKINRNYLVLLASILLITSVAGYFVLHHLILNAAKESLLEKKGLIISQIRKSGEIPNLYPIIEVRKADQLTGNHSGFKITMLENASEHETEPYLEYSEEIMIGDVAYSLMLRQSTFENEDLVLIISVSFFLIIAVSLGITFLLSRKMNRTIWADFENNLESIEQFNFNRNDKLVLKKSDIEEFDRLDRVVEKLTEKLRFDYLSLKEFTENASHEIQTPLSVALIHLDELLQQDLSEEAFTRTMAAIQALTRLSSLNQSLITLAKIENGQFKGETEISLSDLVKSKLQEFETLFQSRKLEVSYTIESDFRLKMHDQLADLLMNNLLSNAIYHNYEGGNIQIVTGRDQITICNTGNPNTLTAESVFNRFTKGDSKSFGLGLAIVKKICDTHQLEIHYIKENLHCFMINKNPLMDN